MIPVRIEHPLRCRSEPHIIIDGCGRNPIGGIPDAGQPIEIGPTACHREFAEFAALYELGGFDHVLATAPLRTHLHDAVVLLRGGHHRATLGNRLGQGLFDIDILARLAGHHGGDRMPVIRRGDEDDINVLPIQHAAEILYRIGLFPSGRRTNLQTLRGHGFIHVGDNHTVHFRIAEETLQVAAAHAAGTDEPKADFVVGAGFARADRTDERPGEGGRANGECGVADELTTG